MNGKICQQPLATPRPMYNWYNEVVAPYSDLSPCLARSAGGHGQQRGGESGERLELETKVREDFTIMEEAPT